MFSKLNSRKVIFAILAVIAIVFSVAGCASGDPSSAAPAPVASTGTATVDNGIPGNSIQGEEQEETSIAYNNAQIAKYDASVFAQYTGPTDEAINDGTRDLTLDNPNRIGYFYLYAESGTLIGSWTVKGKVSSTSSELTETQDVADDNQCGSYENATCSDVIDSPGDDMTYGGEEFGSTGVFFYTPSGALIELNTTGDIPVYSDAPQQLTSKPLLIDNGAAVTSGKVKGTP
jgi:hypothetical protein